MRLRYLVTFMLIAIVASLLLVNTVTGIYSINRLTDEAMGARLKSVEMAFNQMLDGEIRRAEALAMAVAADPSVIDAFEAGDRQGLATRLAPVFQRLKANAGAVQFQFHLPPAKSFLRVHRPDKFGDDLSTFRHTVVETNTSKAIVRGLEFGVEGLGIRAVAPIAKDGRHLGSVEFGLNFGQEFFDAFSKTQDVKAALFVKSDKGLKLYAGTMKQVDALGEDRLTQALSGQEVSFDRVIDGNNQRVLMFPALDYRQQPFGTVVLAASTARFAAISDNAIMISLVVAAIALLAAFGAAIVVDRIVSRPIRRMIDAMNQLAEGDTHVTVPQSQSVLEIGEMAVALRVFQHNAEERERLERTMSEESEKQDARRRMNEEAIASFRDHVSGVMQAFGETSGEIGAVAANVASLSGNAHGKADDAMSSAANVVENVTSVASATEELARSIEEINSQVSMARRTVDAATDEAKQSSEEIGQLVVVTQRIDDVIGLIRAIAGQTNLLALNATIEAARAGESGRGFAVVAGEVKELASQTTRATEEISQQIADIQSYTGRAVQAMQAVMQSMGNIADITGTVALSMNEQSAATREISHSVAVAAQGTHSANDAVAELAEAIRSTSACAERVQNAVSNLDVRRSEVDGLVKGFLEKVG